MSILRSLAEKVGPYLKIGAKRLPKFFRIGVFRVVGIGDNGWLGYLLLTSIVFFPTIDAFTTGGVVGVFGFLGETLGTSTLTLIEAVKTLPTAGNLEFVWGLPPGVNWEYATSLWSFLYSGATVLWFYRGIHTGWVFVFGSDESRLKTVIVFLFLYIPVVYAYTGGVPFVEPEVVWRFVESLPFIDPTGGGGVVVNNTSSASVS